MGGRKSYPLRDVIGDLRQTKHERKELKEAIADKDPQRIAVTTLNVLRQSKDAVRNIANAIDMFSLFTETVNKRIKPEKIKEVATDYWNETKTKKRIESGPEIDRILIDSATKILKKRGRKK